MTAPPDTSLATVAANLYGALMDARPYVVRRLGSERQYGSDRLVRRTSEVLDRVDAALADAAEYLESDGQ